MDDLWRRLRQRKLVQWAVAYVAAAFALLQGVDIVAQQFGWPETLQRGITLALALGFFVTLLLAWYHGERGAQRVSGTELLLLALLLAVGGSVLSRFAGKDAALQASSMPMALEPTQGIAAAASAPDDTSIAVLPFVNMSSDKEQEYFSDGLSEELLNQLAQVPQLRVIARTSSFSFKGKDVDVAAIAKTLNVSNILEGSVRRDGETLRITAQLIRAADSSHLWSQTYDRTLTDIFKVQDDIASEVVNALKIKLLPREEPVSLQRTGNPEAYRLYLLGRDIEAKGGDHPRGVAVLRQAVELDPGYANAWAELAVAYAILADYEDGAAKLARDVDLAFEAAERAVALAPDLAQGYASRGWLRYNRSWDWDGSRSDFERGFGIDPNNVALLNRYATSLFFIFERRQDAIAMSRKATSLDPLAADAWVALGTLLQADGQSEPARQAFRQAIQITRGNNWARYLLGYDELVAGNAGDALAEFGHASEEAFVLVGNAMAQYSLANQREARQALDTLKAKYSAGYAFQIAGVHAWRGENDQAFAWLDRAFRQRDAGMPRLRQDPTLAKLRNDARFGTLLGKMGFPAGTGHE